MPQPMRNPSGLLPTDSFVADRGRLIQILQMTNFDACGRINDTIALQSSKIDPFVRLFRRMLRLTPVLS
jgi:hypothetical protein